MKHIDMNKVYVALLTLGLASCADNWDNFTPPETGPEEEPLAVAFSGHVMSSQMVQGTRADGSVVNLHEYSLPSTEKRAYWRYDATTGKVEKQEQAFYAGVFGCHTGSYKWSELVELANLSETEIATLSDAEKAERTQKLKDYYSANLFYNTKATIGTAQADGRNALSYEPLRFWPNQRLESDATKYEYCTFWAYYPWNAAAASGEYGISITNSELGEGQGMGKVHFTMHPDAAQQNDFMISAPVTDCNRNAYPLISDGNGGQTPKPVPFTFYHALAQVRLYAFIRGTDKLVYKEKEITASEAEPFIYSYTDAWGKGQSDTITQSGTYTVIDEDKSVRWYRTDYLDIRGEKKRADIHYKMEFNNIKTEADFYPEYDAQGRATIGHTAATTLGSATVKHFIMNPYWFRFDEQDQHRYMLNDDYMYGYFEDTPVYKRKNATSANGGLDGIDWTASEWNKLYKYDESDTEKKSPKTTPLHYLDLTSSDWTRERELGVPGTERTGAAEDDKLFSKHYNYCPGNILMVVPQTLNDDDVPHIVLTATGNKAKWNGSEWVKGEEITAKVTLNLLKMEINWESGFIYCYAITDELRPGDDIVRGPESITVVVDTSKKTDQW